MKIIPKFQRGGGFDSFFTTYTPVQIETPRQAQKSSSGSSSEEKGQLTEKQLFNMIKNIDGLPNEMMQLVNNLTDTFRLSKLTGIGSEDLATTYLQSLLQLKIINENKKKYDAALKAANDNGSMAEPAIALDGNLVAQDDNGKLTTISLETYTKNKDKYSILSVSQLANLRAYDPKFFNDQEVFNIINNSMGYEAFQALLDKAKQSLGSSEMTYNGMFTNEGEASKGLALIEKLQNDDKIRALGNATLEGLYEYKIIDKTQLGQIKALTKYIATVLPDRAKTWASIKTGNTNKEKATEDLIFAYLLPQNTESHTFDIDYQGSVENNMNTSKSGNANGDGTSKSKEGFWAQVQAGRGGNNSTFNLLVDKGFMSVDGKFYGTTPGLDQNQSLNDYLTNSGARGMLTDESITFGDVKLATESFNDVMVNAGAGAYVVTLPIKDGKVWLEMVEVFSNFNDEIKTSGVTEGTPQYENKVKELLKDSKYVALAPIMQNNGRLNPSNSRQFLVLEGFASSKTAAINPENRKKVSLDDINSNFVIDAGDDSDLYRTIEQGLSNKERGAYKLDEYDGFYNPGDWFGSYDHVYKGNIYIPLNNNIINAMNADKNDITSTAARSYEAASQIWQQRNNLGATGADKI